MHGVQALTADRTGWKIRRTVLTGVGSAMAALSFMVYGALLPGRVAAASAYTPIPVEKGMQLKTPDGRVVFEYLTKRPENIGLTSPSAACFHPVNTPSGERVTSIAPNDHPQHRGIFFGWHDSAFYEPPNRPNNSPTAAIRSATVRRADFWGWGVYAPRDGRVVQNKVIDHPKNPPTLWHNSRSLWMLNPSITAIGPVVIKPESPLTLRYRVVVHDGPPPVDVLQKLSTEWRAL